MKPKQYLKNFNTEGNNADFQVSEHPSSSFDVTHHGKGLIDFLTNAFIKNNEMFKCGPNFKYNNNNNNNSNNINKYNPT